MCGGSLSVAQIFEATAECVVVADGYSDGPTFNGNLPLSP
jgi:hypothetical protein